MSEAIQNRYDFMFIFGGHNINPNGDPSCDNRPRQHYSTGIGYVTDGCLKRKIRDYIINRKDGEEGYDIFVRPNDNLHDKTTKTLETIGIDPEDKNIQDQIKKQRENNENPDKTVKDYICKTYYDIRAFGGVLAAYKDKKIGLNSGAIKGPVQIEDADSIGPIKIEEVTINNVASNSDNNNAGIVGARYIIPFALYQGYGSISAKQAEKTGFSEEDLVLFFDALKNMFLDDQSSIRGRIDMYKIIIFEHDSAFGNASPYRLFQSIKIKVKDGIKNANDYQDYEIFIDKKEIPEGITVKEIDG